MTTLLANVVTITTVLLSAWIVLTEKLYFARYLSTEQDLTYSTQASVTESVTKCVEKCKSSDVCKYINYHVLSHVCFFIDIRARNDFDIYRKLEKNKGYVFGNKSDWTPKANNSCLVCDGDGTCSVESEQNNTCPVIGCKPPDSKLDVVPIGNMFGMGNKIKYKCLGNRKITGAKRHLSTCLGNGTWSATDFQCLYDCSAAPTIQNGVVTANDINNTTEGAKATVTCNPGYVHDMDTITCLDTGNWQIPTCAIKDCGQAPSVNNGNVTLNSPGITTAGATATVICNSIHVSTITCRTSGVWETPNCKLPIFTCTGESTRLAVSEDCDICLTECSDSEDELMCSCTEDLNRFIALKHMYIKHNNIRKVQNVTTEEDCMAACRAEPGCKSADYVLSDLNCYFNKVMPFEVEPTIISSAIDVLLLRQCDFCYVNTK